MIGAIIAMNIALEAQRRAEEAEQEAKRARKEAQRRAEEDERCRTGNVQGYSAGTCRIGTCVIYGAEAGIACRLGEI